ncbi:MAG: alanine--tRNA ligase [Candidatus Muproteobacteria bacterium RIFCSPHIGHO2_02_FULL_65_16]|uniref:Alanine--tRNA ligase n=1 Tax=Candidatus Muproteobacteria bacterium RIFCSPHIGHO2_02_FULL_65_16 TaxID=1817766 RepID=A0A1F6U2E6_9PROT|nr:MAG: alanine--tRNA ligase [Candidatus Muproteobacteria bacterium RIFCSPHIGHO2_02_FULL_65_16]
MKSTEIRNRFLEYFKRNGHTIVPSSPLVPANDPTLLFTNAGMVQFKETFLGIEKRPYVRAASSQRCVRAGGKHNDLENVGYTARHHTFFEMLGNFSFGDYFKREAIRYAWEFLTRDLKLAPERLWVTVYKDDEQAADIWLKEIGVDPKRFARLGESGNFWSMGDTGPCGPCSEIFYDHGPGIPGGPPGSAEEDGDRYVELWNLVFMQFNRDAQGVLTPLPKPSVDTGMGLERMAAVLQGVHSNYQTDQFRQLIEAAAAITGASDRQGHSLNVVADHIRAAAFLITDGVLPSNEGRGYVLRRIIRRAIRHGHKLGAQETFFYKLVGPLCEQMGAAYPELARARAQVERALKQEEERFNETLEQGLGILEDGIAALAGDTLPGALIFRLYDTYGFPVDLTRDVALERNLKLDMAGFEREMEAQRERARAASSFKAVAASLGERREATTFTGYETTQDQAQVAGIRVGDADVSSIGAGQEGVIYLDRTPFYAESGGQAGDQGRLRTPDAAFTVLVTQKGHAHIGRIERGAIKVGDKVSCEVDAEKRRATACNHSATHLLHAALRKVLGPHVQQKGSLVEPARLRFDFSHLEPVTPEQIQTIEDMVNDEIRANNPVETNVMDLEAALKSGAQALFGEKYGTRVRVVGMGAFSTELCGGTHVRRTGDIGLFKIVSEGGVAAGVRRIEAVTGSGALDYMRNTESRLDQIAGLVRGSRDDAARKVEQLQSRIKGLEKELEQLRGKLARGESVDLASQAKEVKGIKVVAARLDGTDAKGLREAVDRLKDKLAPAAIVLAAVADDKVTLIAGVTKDLTDRLHAGDLVNQVATRVGGKGGGRPDLAQAGGTDPAGLDAALNAVPGWVGERLK